MRIEESEQTLGKLSCSVASSPPELLFSFSFLDTGYNISVKIKSRFIQENSGKSLGTVIPVFESQNEGWALLFVTPTIHGKPVLNP